MAVATQAVDTQTGVGGECNRAVGKRSLGHLFGRSGVQPSIRRSSSPGCTYLAERDEVLPEKVGGDPARPVHPMMVPGVATFLDVERVVVVAVFEMRHGVCCVKLEGGRCTGCYTNTVCIVYARMISLCITTKL